jgi:hypothetical protein
MRSLGLVSVAALLFVLSVEFILADQTTLPQGDNPYNPQTGKKCRSTFSKCCNIKGTGCWANKDLPDGGTNCNNTPCPSVNFSTVNIYGYCSSIDAQSTDSCDSWDPYNCAVGRAFPNDTCTKNTDLCTVTYFVTGSWYCTPP